jgi:hypothetical protein
MNNYKATPEQWAGIEKDSRFELDACILELRSRVEALEDSRFELDACILELCSRVEALEAQAGSREVAEPAPRAGGLVERVSDAITSETGSRWATTEARAAILEVARWLRSELVSRGVAERLEQEAEQ